MEKSKQNNCINQLSAAMLKLLESKGYSVGTLSNYRRILARVKVFMDQRNFTGFTESIGEDFMVDFTSKSQTSIPHHRQVKMILQRLSCFKNGIDYMLIQKTNENRYPQQFTEVLESYIAACSEVGNKENTLSSKRRHCRDFLNHLADAGCDDVYSISTACACRAILLMSNKDSYAVIRSFLRHLYEIGILSRDISIIVPKYRRPIPLPTTYTDDEINRMESSINRSTNTGMRNYAIILLASRLGIRSGDIATLKFSNIDFTNNSINITQNKTGQSLSLPLLPEIREAIQSYIHNARPDVKSEHLFIQAKAPYEKISTSIIRHALTESFHAAGINILNKKHGPHTLRSSMASSMINSSVPYEVVRKALGHADPKAIKHYAKIDIENLRFYSIDTPPPTGMFAMFLQGRV